VDKYELKIKIIDEDNVMDDDKDINDPFEMARKKVILELKTEVDYENEEEIKKK
jgi:hypothetical protein